MTTAAMKIEREIRQLPLDDMLALHDCLIDSIHENEGAQPLDPAYRDEIRRRVQEIDSGTAKGVDAFKELEGM